MKKLLLVAMVGLISVTGTVYAQNWEACAGPTGSKASLGCQNIAGYICAAAMSRDAHISAKNHIDTTIQSYREVGNKFDIPASEFLYLQTVATLAAYGPKYKALGPLALQVGVEAQCDKVGLEAFWKQLEQDTLKK